MSHGQSMMECCRLLARIVIGLVFAAGLAPTANAQDSRVAVQGKSAAAAVEAESRQPHDAMSGGPASGSGAQTAVSVAVPVGSVTVGAEFAGGEPRYARRLTIRDGMTIVAVSAIPDGGDGPAATGSFARPEAQPASW